MDVTISRAPWPENFPEVVVHGRLPDRNRHPEFAIAKAGNAGAALSLVRDLMNDAAMDRLRAMLIGRQPFLIPITAIEVTGFNAIPDAMVQTIGGRLGCRLSIGSILQSNKVAHTNADGWHRLVTPATFTGNVVAGAEYLLVDDHVGFGGTFANLRGHIEKAGGRVLGMTALTETGGGREIAVPSAMLSVLRSTHGKELEQFWQDHFGYGLGCLTKLEAGYLCRVESFDAIRTRLAEAAERARRRGVSAIDV